MALVAHTIVSRYTPQEREPIIQPVVPEDDPWQKEHSFGAAQRLHSRPPPYFVAAVLEYDEYGMPRPDTTVGLKYPKPRDAAEDVSAWYRSLRRRRSRDENPCEPSSSSQVSSSRYSPQNTISEPPPTSTDDCTPPRTATTNWFTSHPRAVDASMPTFTQPTSKPSAFADLLSRNPPPLPLEPAFKPPVFLALGPANRGFTMLQRKGWQEGEGLGSGRVERTRREGINVKRNAENTLKWTPHVEEHKTMLRPEYSTHEVIDLTLSDSDPEHEVVDLTLYASESDPEQESEDAGEPFETLGGTSKESRSHGTTLLTPIATTLKADRLGIGLKAARRSSNAKVKAVTHTSAALAAHIRSGNKLRNEKARHGRGSRGFARSKRKEERERVGLLAYMNS